MGLPKKKVSDFGSLYQKSEELNLHDKKTVEALIKRLNEMMQDPAMAKKAAMIIESMINSKNKR